MTVQWGVSDLEAVFWGDLALFGDRVEGGQFTIHTIEGWEDLPDAREGWQSRPDGHGTFDAPVWADARRIKVGGTCTNRVARDEMLRQLKRGFVFPSNPRDGLRPLSITIAGQSLSVQARLTRFKPTIVAGRWGVGSFGWAAEWVAPDPLRYAEPVMSVTGLPSEAGGLTFPLFTDGSAWDSSVGSLTGFLEFGEVPVSGRVSFTNSGTADTMPVFLVSGPVPDVQIIRVGSGERVEAVTSVPAGGVLTIDSASGLATLDTLGVGAAVDRSGTLTRREWAPVRPGETAEWLFGSSGFDPAASLSVVAAPAFW